MPKSRPPYAAEFRRQMVELVRSGRTPEALARDGRCVTRGAGSAAKDARSALTRRPALRYFRRTCPRHRATRTCPVHAPVHAGGGQTPTSCPMPRTRFANESASLRNERDRRYAHDNENTALNAGWSTVSR